MQRGLANPDIVRLWTIGGTNNLVRWLEILAAALFTLEVTGSGFAVAAVSAARTLPLLLFGAVAGVVSESVNRKHILLTGMLVTASCSLAVCLLARAGAAQPWHIAAAAFVSGIVWSSDMATRRRMVGEAAAPDMVGRAIALDSLAGALTRMTGPMLGATAYGLFGLSGAFAFSSAIMLAAFLYGLPIRHSQPAHPLTLSRVPRDLAEGFASARGDAGVRAVLGTTIAMNLFGFAYVAVVAPIGRLVYEIPVALVGALAAAEPVGSLIGGLVLAWIPTPTTPRRLLLGGSFLFLLALLMMPLMPSYWLACLMLLLGGIGLAGFSNTQTTLILTGAPAQMRSRLLGLTTVCMGFGPVGSLMIGALADGIGPMRAVLTMTAAGIASLALVSLSWIRSAP